MKISGHALVIEGDDVAADLIYPSRYLTVTDRAEQARYIFEGIASDMPEKVCRHPVLVTGWNLGPGSAREQTATGMLGAGVKLVIGKSFSRTFFRNALNNGLPLIASPELAAAIRDGSTVTVDLAEGTAEIDGKTWTFQSLPKNLLQILRKGGVWGTFDPARHQPQSSETAPTAKVPAAHTGSAPKTLVEKIMSRGVGRSVKAGEFVELVPDWTFALDDGIGAANQYLADRGVKRIHHPERVALFFDHFAPADNAHHASIQRVGREFAARHRIHALYEVGEGISHQVAVEKGLATPGQIAVSMDSHNMTVGGAGVLGLGVGNSEMAFIWAAGATWFQVPRSLRVELNGRLKQPVAAKDVMLGFLRDHGARWASYKAIEYDGDGLEHLGIAERMTLCNMGPELGAKTAIVRPDHVTAEHYRALGIEADFGECRADEGATYEDRITVDLAALVPMVACPHTVANVHPVSEVAGTPIHQAFLGTCTNGRYEDLVEAARILKGRRIAHGVRMIVTPASRGAMLRAVKEGVIETLIEAGCTITTPGCGACAGVHQGVLGDGEACIASSSRNFLGRMGNRKGSVYLGSPATVAASALAGRIEDPRSIT